MLVALLVLVALLSGCVVRFRSWLVSPLSETDERLAAVDAQLGR